MTSKSALLVGASGLVGGELLRQLLDSDRYKKVTLFVRQPLPLDHPKLEQIVVDFENLTAYREHVRVDDLFCCLGTTIKKAGSKEAFRRVDYAYPQQLAQLAKEEGVKNFLLITAMGANAASNIFYSRVKGEVEADIRSLNLPALHIFRPSLLLGERNEFRFGEQVGAVFSKLLAPLMPRKYRPIQGKTVAAAMIRAAQSEQSGTQIYPSDHIAAFASPRN